MTERTHIFRFITLALLAAMWVFMLLACGSFSAGDWPSHTVYPPPPIGNACGIVGAFLAYHCFVVIGHGIYPILLACGACIFMLLVKGRVGDFAFRAVGLLLLSVSFAAIVHFFKPGSADGFPEGNGGLVGIAVCAFLVKHFSFAGGLLVMVTALLIGLLLAADDLVLKAPKVAVAAAGSMGSKFEATRSLGDRIKGKWHEMLPDFLRKDYRIKPAAVGVAGSVGGGGGGRSGPTLEDADPEVPLFDKRVLLNRHNLDDEEVNLTYAEDEAVVGAVDPNAAAAGEIALADDLADSPPAEGAIIPEISEKREIVINNATAVPGQNMTTPPTTTPTTATGPSGEVSATAALGAVAPAAAARPEIVVRNASAVRPKPTAPIPPPPQELGEYQLPSMEFLADAEHGYAESQERYVREKAAVLEQALREFGIDATVVAIDTGPVITMYELALPTGMKVASITQLNNDIARALKAISVRIVAPVPGKDTVGIEVPNPHKEKVRLKELFQLAPEAAQKMAIPIFLGKDASGQPLVTDLTKMPHCLIAGTTGSGKSVCINTIVMSIMYLQRPDHVKLILIDPKVVELKPFEQIPHLMCPPINDPNRAPPVLEWLCQKMDERYELLAEAAVRQISDYNKLTREQLNEIFKPGSPEEEAKIPKFLPYIVVIIDELADLMMMSGKEVEASIVRLAQKSRAVGIHVILATQRPQANVVTGLIKSNMPSRIAFRVQSRMDSRIVLDQNGAELLLGQGDMLFMPPGASKPIRSQGTFIDDLEVRQSVKLVKGLAEAQYEPELVQIRQIRADSEFEHDDLYDDAVKIVIETKRGSVSLLQRRLSVGYARASRLIERMAATGILGDYKGSQSREVLFTLEEWEAAKAQMQKDTDDGMTV
jgi:DNA segregation ATPase FtsK/SpoIIIE, S-DNA-T family